MPRHPVFFVALGLIDTLAAHVHELLKTARCDGQPSAHALGLPQM
jgi:hypothetical protein